MAPASLLTASGYFERCPACNLTECACAPARQDMTVVNDSGPQISVEGVE